MYKAEPGEVRGWFTNIAYINYLSNDLLQLPLQRRHSLKVINLATSHTFNHVAKL